MRKPPTRWRIGGAFSGLLAEFARTRLLDNAERERLANSAFERVRSLHPPRRHRAFNRPQKDLTS